MCRSDGPGARLFSFFSRGAPGRRDEKQEAEQMTIFLQGTPEEIAALADILQERRPEPETNVREAPDGEKPTEWP